MAKKGKGRGLFFFGTLGIALSLIPIMGKVKSVLKNTKKKAKKKRKKKRKKKKGKVFTKARKLLNTLSRRRLARKFKRAVKKAVLAVKKTTKKSKKQSKTQAAVKQAKKNAKAAAKEYEKNQNAKLASMMANYIPVFGNIKAVYEYGTGKDLFTGQKLATPRSKYINLEKSCPAPQKYSVNDGEPVTTLTDLRQVLSKPSTVTPDGLAPIALGANLAYSLLAEDLVTLADPNATPKEHFDAFISSINPVGKAKKGKKAMETFNDLENALEAANDAKKAKDVHYTQKEIEKLGEYSKKLDKGKVEVFSVNIPKNVERQYKKLSPEAKKGFDKAKEGLKTGDLTGLNNHSLGGNRAGQFAVDIKGLGKGRGAGRLIYEKKNGEIHVIEILTKHDY